MNREERKFVYKRLIEKYGETQVIVAIEELSELQKELCKSLRGKTNRENIIEEIADVAIMLEQMILYFQITKEELSEEMTKKIDRTKERLFSKEEFKNETKTQLINHILVLNPKINVRKLWNLNKKQLKEISIKLEYENK